MIGWIDLFYFAILGAALLLSVLGLCFSAVTPVVDRWSRRFFLDYFIVLTACCLASLAETTLYVFPVPSEAIRFILFLESLLLSLPLPMLTVYLLHCCGESIRESRLLHAVFSLWTVFFLLIASGLFTNSFTYVTPENAYYRGPLYPLLLLPLIAIQLFTLAGTICHRAKLSPKIFRSFLIALLPMTGALILNLFIDAIPVFDISFVLSALSMYSLIQSDQIEQNLRQQQEIADQRASIMVLQMRPHFIYNTLMSIYSLCRQDPEKARQVIMDFTAYLRKNFTAVASSTPIPFSSELDHTRAYLAVEQAQYEDSLSVDYDTPHTLFRVPPLTLQPIVENAVNHGRDPYAGALHISIRTRKTDSGSEIVVADNGRGFDPADDSEQGIALKNIRQRLKTMCGGELTILPRDGGGTVVKVTIPGQGQSCPSVSPGP